MSRSLGRTAQIGPLFSKIGPKLFAGDGAVSSSFDRRAMLGWNIPARHPRPNCLMANSDQIGKRLLRPGDLDCSGDVVMEAHNQHSTTVECKGQQLCIGNLQMRSSLPPMNMGKRLKQELADRGMDPIALCELVPEMGIGTLSAMYTRDSQWSKFAPAIAKALNLELEWLLTGEGRKERLDQSGMTDHGQLVRQGRDIEIFDYSKGEYVDVEVQSIRRVGSKVEVEVTDNETGEDRTLEMDAD